MYANNSEKVLTDGSQLLLTACNFTTLKLSLQRFMEILVLWHSAVYQEFYIWNT